MMGSKVSLERRRGFILTTFYFNRDDLCSILQDKINLTVLVRIVARLNLKLPAKLLQDIVLGQRSFELIVSF